MIVLPLISRSPAKYIHFECCLYRDPISFHFLRKNQLLPLVVHHDEGRMKFQNIRPQRTSVPTYKTLGYSTCDIKAIEILPWLRWISNQYNLLNLSIL